MATATINARLRWAPTRETQMTTPFKRSTLASVLALLATHASASGFQINEHSAAGLGRAFAGEGAIADSTPPHKK